MKARLGKELKIMHLSVIMATLDEMQWITVSYSTSYADINVDDLTLLKTPFNIDGSLIRQIKLKI